MPIFTPIQTVKLIELAKKNRIAPIYLLIGPENICREKAKEIYQVLKEKNALLEVYDLKDEREKKVFHEIKGYQESLFGVRKVYFVLGAEGITYEKGEEIIESLQNKKDSFSWFLISEDFSEVHPLYQYANEKGAIILFSTKREEDILESELIRNLKSYGKTMDKNTASLFLSLVGKDYNYFKNELEKLIFYTDDKSVITEEDIWEVVIPSEDNALYLLADTFFNYGPERAYKMVLNLLDRKIDPPKILWYLYKFFKKMEIFNEFLKKHPELFSEKRYSNFSKKFLEIKDDPLEEIPKIIADSHPYSLFSMKNQLEKIENFDFIFEELFRADLAMKRDFKNPAKVFNELFLNLWYKMEKKS
jgi:DNA polymerase-3 subunit delta